MAKFSLICCIVNMGDSSKLLKIASKYGARDAIISIGKGTVHNQILQFLQINETRKEIITMIVETETASAAIKGISKDMAFDKPHHGIGFSCLISEFIGSNEIEKNKKVSEVKASMYNAIYVIVDKGRAEEVIEAAKKVGARGGTIINARHSGLHETQKLFSIEIEPEKEKALIITKAESKDDIVEAIKAQLKTYDSDEDIIFVLDVNEAYGLHGK